MRPHHISWKRGIGTIHTGRRADRAFPSGPSEVEPSRRKGDDGVMGGLSPAGCQSLQGRKGGIAAATEERSNFVLIGMPGAGKSTVGILLAKLTSRDFVDTDVLIQVSRGRSLQEIVDTEGHMALRRIEEDVLLGLRCRNHVIATGGSAVYSHTAMAHLKSHGIAVFLDTNLATLKARVRDFDTRGLAKRPDQSFADLFEERLVLYRRYADITVTSSRGSHEEVCARIMAALKTEQLSRR
jgi:shikimate kinase